MSDLTKDQVIEWLSSQSVIEISDLVKELEEKWGVSAAAPAAVAVAAPAAGDAGGSLGAALALWHIEQGNTRKINKNDSMKGSY